MSSRILATPSASTRRVALNLWDFPAGQPVEIWRTDANGRRRVRAPRGAVHGATWYGLVDHEAALTGNITYEAAGTRTNELTNPGFETDTAGWAIFGTGATLTRDTVVMWNGAASGKLTNAGTGAFLQMAKANEEPAQPGDVWQLRVTARAVDGATYDVRLLDQAGAVIFDGPSLPGTAGVWRDHIYPVTIPAGVTHIRLAVTLLTGATMWVDRLTLERAPTFQGYIEGTVPATVVSAPATLTDAARPAGPFIHAAAKPTTLPVLTGGPVTDWRPTRDTGAQLVDVIGRADAIDTGPALARTRAHSLTVRLDTLAAARQLEDLITAGRTIVVRHNTPGLDTTLTVQAIDGPTPDPSNPRRWLVALRGREALAGPYLADPPT